jgi:hypothetical protein
MTAEDWKRRSVCTSVSDDHDEEDMMETDLEVLCDLTDKTLEGKLADEELRRLLVATNLSESDGTRPEAVRLLHTTSDILRVRQEEVSGEAKRERWDLRRAAYEPETWRPWWRAAYEGPYLTKKKTRMRQSSTSTVMSDLPPVDLRAVCYTQRRRGGQ